jgi:two-component system chemotaxis response regulator CheB
VSKKAIRVLIVDDSASVRHILTSILSEDTGISVIGAVADPFAAARRLQEELPDVIILDIEMPRMDASPSCAKSWRNAQFRLSSAHP